MADYLTTDTELTSVANAIRLKAEISGSLEFPSGFISAINSITGGGMTVTRTQDAAGGEVLTITGEATEVEPLSVNTNGTYTAPSGKAYTPVNVNVSGGGSTVAVGFTNASSNPKICYIDSNGVYHSEGGTYDGATYTYSWSANVTENAVIIIFYDPTYMGAVYSNLSQEEVVSLGARATYVGALIMRAVVQ